MSFDRTDFNREVGLRLKIARQIRNRSQAHMAKQIGITRANYASIEIGRQRIPVDVLWRACRVLNISIASVVPPPITATSHTALAWGNSTAVVRGIWPTERT